MVEGQNLVTNVTKNYVIDVKPLTIFTRSSILDF